MASVHPNLAFDTLAFAKTLIEKGYDRKLAEALAEAQREFFVHNLATKESVDSTVQEAENRLSHEISEVENNLTKEISDVESKLTKEISAVRQEVTEIKYAVKEVDNKIDREIARLENRLTKTFGRMFVAAVSVLAIIMPVIYIVLQKLLLIAP